MRPGFYNENQFRDYPFKEVVEPRFGLLPQMNDYSGGAPPVVSTILYGIRRWIGDDIDVTEVDQDPIVDFNSIMGVASTFRSGVDTIYLHEIDRTGSAVTFKFKSSVTDDVFSGATLDIVFTAQAGFQINNATITAAGDTDCESGRTWEGFLAVSDLDIFIANLPDPFMITFPDSLLVVEPSRVQTLADSYVTAINLANKPRAVVEAPDECTEIVGDTEILPYATCFDGDVEIREGFNATIRQDRRENKLTLGAGVGIGAGVPCEEIQVHPEEVPPDDGGYLTGGPTCAEILKSINGVGGSNVTLRAGSGFRIIVDPVNPNTLIVNRSLDDFALCVDPPLIIEPNEESSSDSSSSNSSEGG